MDLKRFNKFTVHIVSLCILLFILLFIYAASLYPGGSQFDSNAAGFSWKHNYWCNLMNDIAENGMQNPARYYAISANAILCIGCMLFFLRFGLIRLKIGYWRNIYMNVAKFEYDLRHDSFLKEIVLFAVNAAFYSTLRWNFSAHSAVSYN